MYEKPSIRIAILDLYEGHANQGMRCLREIVNTFAENTDAEIEWNEFDVRGKNQLPDLTYDIYISSGGPGSPIDTVDEVWDKNYMNWFETVIDYNQSILNERKKYVLFICHSFQLVCRHLDIANVCARKSTSFGVFPMHLLIDGYEEPVFEKLNNPFYAVDSRDYQVIQPNHEKLASMGAKLLAIEKERPHVPLERAIMAIRFNDYMLGTQFHPEADPIGMSLHLKSEEKKKTVIENHGEEKWQSMIDHLQDPEKIVWTYNNLIPNFLKQSFDQLVQVSV
jgi:GMP synthase-like glutamine amidotransferase